MKLEDLEAPIQAYARRFASDPDSIEDLQQIGRIAVWNLLQKNPEATVPFAMVEIKSRMIDELRNANAQKRKPAGGLVRLTGGEDDDSSLEEIIGKEDSVRVTGDSLLEGLRNKFGRFYLEGIKSGTQPRVAARGIVRAIVEDIGGISPKDAPQAVTYNLFVETGFQPFLWAFYDNSPYAAVMDAYKNQVTPWDFRVKPNGFWRGHNKKRHIRAALEWFASKHKLDKQSDLSVVTRTQFEEAGLTYLLNTIFNGSPFLALKQIFPGLKPWERQVPANYYASPSNRKEAIDAFLIQAGIVNMDSMNSEEAYEAGIRLVVSKQTLCDFGLRGLLVPYKGSPYRLFADFFPKQILPWTIHGSKEVWRENPKETAAQAVRWLFDKYLRIPSAELPEYATNRLFWNVGFSGILTNRSIGFNSSTYEAINNAYPQVYSRSDFSRNRPTSVVTTKSMKRSR